MGLYHKKILFHNSIELTQTSSPPQTVSCCELPTFYKKLLKSPIFRTSENEAMMWRQNPNTETRLFQTEMNDTWFLTEWISARSQLKELIYQLPQSPSGVWYFLSTMARWGFYVIRGSVFRRYYYLCPKIKHSS